MKNFQYVREQRHTFRAADMDEATSKVAGLKLLSDDDQSGDPGTVYELEDFDESPDLAYLREYLNSEPMAEWPMNLADAGCPSRAELVERMRGLEDEILEDDRYHHGEQSRIADVFTNSPLALIQMGMNARLGVLQEMFQFIGEERKDHHSKREPSA